VGLLSWTVLDLRGELFDSNGIFKTLTGSWYFPVQPIDLIFMGSGLLLSTALLDFLTKFYDLNQKGLLAVLPWTIVGQYRYLNEFVWVFQYWITMNTQAHAFSDSIRWLDGTMFPPAVLTHMYTMLFIVFSIFNLFVILQESKKKDR
jgi:hypothetical protein